MCGIWGSVRVIPEGNNSDFCKIRHRGPDKSKIEVIDNVFLGFHRLSMNDESDNGMGPYKYKETYCVSNGEIYNWEELKEEYLRTYDFKSKCDTEVLLYLYDCFGKDINKVIEKLDGEYAFVIFDKSKGCLYCCCDELSTRPLFLAKDKENNIFFSSELIGINNELKELIRIPGNTMYIIDIKSQSMEKVKREPEREKIVNIYPDHKKLRELIISNVSKKLYTKGSNREQGFFLSGGLDSSLIASIAARLLYPKRIKTFSFGFDERAPDLEYARVVSSHINSEHHEILIDKQETFDNLPSIIKQTGTWDQTTIRASSVLYMATKWIKENHPEICVMMTGELADEIFGSYLYFFKSPSNEEFTKERKRLLENVHNFDGLRCDRVLAGFGIEGRYPYFSKEILKYIDCIDPEYLNPVKTGLEKKCLREAFTDYLPNSIIMRRKEALSDGTSHSSSWKDFIKDKIHGNSLYKEDSYYKKIFKEYYPGSLKEETIPFKWMPKWQNPELVDSSATMLNLE
jgi:asparagine synthase (glutamine-hydrolysing)